VQDTADAQAEKFIDRAHPFAVARGEIVVHRDDVNAPTGKRIEKNRQGADERLAFAGGHFRNLAGMQRVTADQLDVKRHHFPPERMPAHDDVLAAQTTAGVFHHGEGFGENFPETAGEFPCCPQFWTTHPSMPRFFGAARLPKPSAIPFRAR